MKKIVLACGSGIATSTAVAQKVSALLNDNGYEGQYEIVQCAISEAKLAPMPTCSSRRPSLRTALSAPM